MSSEQNINTTTLLDNLVEQFRTFSLAEHEAVESELLRQRAAQYADVPQDARADDDLITVITFTLHGETYGLPVSVVTGVRRLPSITRVPGAPDFYPGVANLRGAVVTLFDLRRFFNLPAAPDPGPPPDELIVVVVNSLTLGLIVHRVREVIDIPRQDIYSLDDVRYTLGAYVSGQQRWVILDPDEIFFDERLMGN